MCKASHEPGGPLRCSGDARAQLARSAAAVAHLEHRSARLAGAGEQHSAESAAAAGAPVGGQPPGPLVRCAEPDHPGVHAPGPGCREPARIGRSYLDAAGRTQFAVEGPRGTVLITRQSVEEPWDLWLTWRAFISGRGGDLDALMRRAAELAGLDEAASGASGPLDGEAEVAAAKIRVPGGVVMPSADETVLCRSCWQKAILHERRTGLSRLKGYRRLHPNGATEQCGGETPW